MDVSVLQALPTQMPDSNRKMRDYQQQNQIVDML